MVFTALSLSCVRDIRPQRLLDDKAPMQERARALLLKSAEVHGLKAWKAAKRIEVLYDDSWPMSMMRAMGTPLTEATQKVRMSFKPGSDDNLITIYGGVHDQKKVSVVEGVTQSIMGGESKVETGLSHVFYSPAIQYLFELSFRVLEADDIAWAGEAVIDERDCDVVLATWGGLEPNSEFDQYLLYIDRKTHRLLFSEYTIRQMGQVFKSNIRYDDYRRVDGILMAFFNEIEMDMGAFTMHLHSAEVEAVSILNR